MAFVLGCVDVLFVAVPGNHTHIGIVRTKDKEKSTVAIGKALEKPIYIGFLCILYRLFYRGNICIVPKYTHTPPCPDFKSPRALHPTVRSEPQTHHRGNVNRKWQNVNICDILIVAI